MKRFDVKHTVFHILVGLYFIWAFIFAALLAMAISNTVEPRNSELTGMFPVWILMNLVMGSALYVVMRMFRSKDVINKAVRVSFIALAAAALGIMAYMAIKA
ncbi:hypothetical protein OGH69_00455 [Flavobacterium sp. MFBS3-15]|uniref:hypothetical protein n=1 Tax=Flavobacterium sp. MFBS3-15 TaxID=2989816 RepID=UPI0022367646|nr:hypothetical protein [Flavobacterium sp. MFBS3-15]MCW4467424.1 hypothetical protein [Flavobacterium sp. MFBS3-15]